MQLLLNELFKIPIMSQALIRTAAETLPFRAVESVSVIEIPVENFVRKNELVISTAIGCNNDTDIFIEFVKDIFESGAAALVIAVGRHVKIIPEKVLQVSEKLHFPIIEIPWEIRFSDITEAVLNELYNRHLTNLKKYDDLQNKLLNLFINGSDLSDALELIQKELENPIIIIDNRGRIKGKSRKTQDFIKILNPYIEQAFSISDICRADEPFNMLDDSVLVYKIQSADKLHGYILLQLLSDKIREASISNERENMIRYITPSIMLWFQKEQTVRETEIRLRDDFVWSIAKGEVDSWENMNLRAKSMGYNLSIPYFCIVGLIMPKGQKGAEWEQLLPNSINTIKEQVIWVGKQIELMAMVTYQQDRLVIFLEAQNSQILKTSNKFLDIIENRLKKLLPNLIMSWGIGEDHAGVRTFHESFIDANIALDICYSQEGPGHRSTYARTGIYRVLRMIVDNKDLKEIMQLITNELVRYDKERGLDLINTLKVYIQNQENVSQTANALNLHRQSLLYRLKKIEALTNRSLSDPDDLFLLDLSIRIRMCSTK